MIQLAVDMETIDDGFPVAPTYIYIYIYIYMIIYTYSADKH